MQNNRYGKDLTIGNIPRHLISFAVPMLFGNLIQISYSIINTMWVGHLVGEDAVGAAGLSFFVLFLTIGLAVGLTMAATILVSQYYGAKNDVMVKRVVDNSFSLTLAIGIIITVVGILLSDFILKLMNAPPENFSMASSYLKLSLLSTIFMYMAFLIGAILRGIGDTVTPLIFMSLGIGLNAILDPFFIGGFGPFPSHGLNGAAIATLVSQFIALAANLIYFHKKSHFVTLNFKKLVFDKKITLLIFKIGLPSIVQQSLLSIASMFVSSFVNAFGSAATNAFGAIIRVDMFAFMPAISIGMAASSLTGQNLGAGKPERVREIFKWGVIISSTITILISLFAVLFAKYILMAFGLGDDPKALEVGISYMRIVGSCYLFFGLLFVSNGIINGAGHTMTAMVISLVSLWVVRVPGSWFLSKTTLGISGVWVAMAISFVVSMLVSMIYYFSGRWKKTVIMKPAEAVPPLN